MLDHVVEAERSYLVQLGARHRLETDAAAAMQWRALRGTVDAILAARAEDLPIAQPSGARNRWLPRYFVRRAAWHVLDHAWEIEDRASPAA